MPVNFHQLITVNLQNKKNLKTFIAALFKKEGKQMEQLDIIFCTDAFLLEMNRSHLSHNYFTDILTFDLSVDKNARIVGELYISVDRVRDNANSHNVSIKNELHRVIFHGVLHLCGYNDKKKKEGAIMKKMEEKYLGLYFNN